MIPYLLSQWGYLGLVFDKQVPRINGISRQIIKLPSIPILWRLTCAVTVLLTLHFRKPKKNNHTTINGQIRRLKLTRAKGNK